MILFGALWFLAGFVLVGDRPFRAVAAWRERMALAKRHAAIERQLPDAFDGMVAALRAGRSVAQAVEWFAHEGPEPLADELAAVGRAMQLGATFEEALGDAARRLALPGLQTAALTLGPLRAAGANLTLALEGMASVLRRRAATAGKLATLTAQARLQLIFMGAVFPALLGILFLMQPELIGRLFFDATGRLFLLLGLGLQVLSYAGARRILNPTNLWT